MLYRTFENEYTIFYWEKILINPVGRPKLLDRDHLISIALQEYWSYGIDNVSMTSIASLAKVSRPGIYKEFNDEDGLKYEVLKSYTNILREHVIPQYNTSKDIKTLYYHFYSTIGIKDCEKYFKGISKLQSLLTIPKEVKGCFFEGTKLKKHKLNSRTKRELNNFEKYRKNILLKYIKVMQETKQISSSMHVEEIYEFIIAQLNLAQSLTLNGMDKKRIKLIIDKAFTAFVTPDCTIH